MNTPSPFSNAASAGATVGIMAVSVKDGRPLGSLEERTWFPLASAAKLVVGCLAVDAVRIGNLRWDTQLSGLEMDENEPGVELYPHLKGQHELELRDVVEVMIAGLDHSYAVAVVERLGGWEALVRRLRDLYPRIKVSSDPTDHERNAGRLDAVASLVRSVALGHREDARLWRPVIAGLVRQRYKADGIPEYHLLNIQGGLDDALIDIGLLGDISTDNLVAYAVAAKAVADPTKLLAIYETAEGVIQDLYQEHIAPPPPRGYIELRQIQ